MNRPPADDGAVPADGRLARGERRRASIIASTLRDIEERGVGGVTHRTVAERAAVRPSLVAYHFATLDELLVAALESAAAQYREQYEALVAAQTAPLAAIARIVADASGPGRARALAERELILLAARRPALRPLTAHWSELVTQAVSGHTTDPEAVQAVIALTDGICTGILLGAAGIDAGEIEARLERLLDVLW